MQQETEKALSHSWQRASEARPAGFEPATYGLEVRCSIQLSYERLTVQVKRRMPLSLTYHSSLA